MSWWWSDPSAVETSTGKMWVDEDAYTFYILGHSVFLDISESVSM